MGKEILKEILLGFVTCNFPFACARRDLGIQTCLTFQGFHNCTCISFGCNPKSRLPLGQPIFTWIALDSLGDLISPGTSAGKLLFSIEGVDYNHPCQTPSSFLNCTENYMSRQVELPFLHHH